MDIIRCRQNYTITISRRGLLIALSLASFSIGAGVVLAVAPILRDAVVMTTRNAEAIRQAGEDQRKLRAQIEELKKEYSL